MCQSFNKQLKYNQESPGAACVSGDTVIVSCQTKPVNDTLLTRSLYRDVRFTQTQLCTSDQITTHETRRHSPTAES